MLDRLHGNPRAFCLVSHAWSSQPLVESVDPGSLSKLRLVMKQLSRVRQAYKFIKAHRRQARAKLQM